MSRISIDPILLILAETTHITSAMRKNARWAHSGMATILGVPPSADGDDGTLASRLGLRTRKSSLGSVSVVSLTVEGNC